MPILPLRLAKQLEKERNWKITLLTCAYCKKGCYQKFLNNQKICPICTNEINKELSKYHSHDSKNIWPDFLSNMTRFFDFKTIPDGGHKFFLDAPAKSFRSLNKNARDAYSRIVRTEMAKRKIQTYNLDEELSMKLELCVNDRYANTDVDNMAKSLLDALKGILYVDDRKIKTLTVTKYYVHDKSLEEIILTISKA